MRFSGRETIDLGADGSSIDFSSVAQAAPDGVDFVPATDPIYVDLRIDGQAAPILFTGADTSRLVQSGYNPVAFTSPDFAIKTGDATPAGRARFSPPASTAPTSSAPASA